jgi:VIT1/CCC1 family predicted Fe2+/Mn2+ transporter
MEKKSPLARLQAEHQPEASKARLAAIRRGGYLADAVLGSIDGCVTTFAVVAGSFGGGLSGRVAIILGLANLLADGFSMGASNYLVPRVNLRNWRRRAEANGIILKKSLKVSEKRFDKFLPEKATTANSGQAGGNDHQRHGPMG